MRKAVFYLSLLTAAAAVTAYLWPVSRDELIPVYGDDGKMGYVNTDGRVVIEMQWEAVGSFDECGRARVMFLNTKSPKLAEFRVIDRHGNMMPGTWAEIGAFDEHGMAFVFDENDKLGWIGMDGQVIIPPEELHSSYQLDPFSKLYRTYRFDSSGMLALTRERKWGWLGRDGEWVIKPEWDEVFNFEECGLVRVRKGDLWGAINRSGDIVIPIEWDLIDEFNSDGIATVYKREKQGLINTKGEMILPIEQATMRHHGKEDLVVISRDGKTGIQDLQGNIVVPFEWQDIRSQEFGERLFTPNGLLAVKRDDKWGCINREGKIVSPLKWSLMTPFDKGGTARVMIKQENSRDWLNGWIDQHGKLIIPPLWDACGHHIAISNCLDFFQPVAFYQFVEIAEHIIQ